MTTATVNKQWTAQEYLAFERKSKEKHEFLHNTLIPTAGASKDHNIIGGNLFALLWFFLRDSDCIVFQNDMRVFNPLTGSYFYPDVVISAGVPILSEDAEGDILTNPALIIEVLSPSTAVYDKTDKFIASRSSPSLVEYVLVAQDRMDFEIYRKQEHEHWTSLRLTEAQSVLTFHSLPGFECLLSEAYKKVLKVL